MYYVVLYFFNDTATTEIYTLSLHDALPIWNLNPEMLSVGTRPGALACPNKVRQNARSTEKHSRNGVLTPPRSEEHTSELQSRQYLVCRLLLEKNTSP